MFYSTYTVCYDIFPALFHESDGTFSIDIKRQFKSIYVFISRFKNTWWS